MTTAYTNLLGFALPVTGELSGTWGDVVNNSITELVEDSIAGQATASVTSGDWTLTTTGSGAANQARCAILIPTGTPGVLRNVIAPSSSKAYIVINQSDADIVVKGSATTGVTIKSGDKAVVAWDGSDFVQVSNLGTVTSVGGTGTVNGISLTGTVTSSGNLTLGGSLSGVNLATQVTGTLPVANGGTGQTTQQAAVNALVGSTTNGYYLRGNGSNAVMAPVQAADITGAVAVANGGTGLTSIPAYSIPVANSANTYTTVTPLAGQSVRVNASGTAWEAYTPASGSGSGTVTSVSGTGSINGITLTGTVTTSGSLTLGGSLSGVNLASQVTGTLPVANGGTGLTNISARSIPVANALNTYTTVTPLAGQSIRINAGNTAWEAYTPASGTVSSVSGTGSVNGITLSGTVTSSGSIALGGALSNVSLSSQVTGTLPVANGGTGVTSSTGNTAVVLSVTPTITALREVKTSIAASDINLSLGNYFSKTISGTTTFTVSNVPTSGTSASFILDLTNGGSQTINWWSGLKWASGVAPTLTASGRDVLGFYTYDNGVIWSGFVLGKDLT